MAVELLEMIRKLKRGLDGYVSYRKAFLLIIIVFALLLYLGPYLLSGWKTKEPDLVQRCLSDQLDIFRHEVSTYDTLIQRDGTDPTNPLPPTPSSATPFLPYVGNGLLGLSLRPSDSALHIRRGRTLSLPLPFHPLVSVSPDSDDMTLVQEAAVLQILSGTVHLIQCGGGRAQLRVHQQVYAHRTQPAVLVQELKVSNPSSMDLRVQLERVGVLAWAGVQVNPTTITHGEGSSDYLVITGSMSDVLDNRRITPVAVMTAKLPSTLEVKAKSSSTFKVLTAVNYTDPILTDEHPEWRETVSANVQKHLQRALGVSYRRLREDHVRAWNQLWRTGFSISQSKAQGALNGDQINSTMYYVLSQVRAPIFESDPDNKKTDVNSLVNYMEGCYSGHQTLQAENLWPESTVSERVLTSANYWLLTLEKQGCYRLLRSGASGVLQGMVLSFGALKFSDQHLEFNTHPKDLHRDYLFRRLLCGNATYVNISVAVQEDNRAALYVALDRSDRSYYACDAGCLDAPVQLGMEYLQLPVKLTSPVTSILYITRDRQHIELLRHTIHVKDVGEAPAHEHHVIALHKHGHSLGGLPTLFWVSISFLIIVFHLFLFKLIYNEYYGNQDKYRSR